MGRKRRDSVSQLPTEAQCLVLSVARDMRDIVEDRSATSTLRSVRSSLPAPDHETLTLLDDLGFNLPFSSSIYLQSDQKAKICK